MNCAIFQENLSDYLEGSAEKNLRPSLASHLIECPECRGLYEDVRFTMALCKDAKEMPIAPELSARIVRATTTGTILSCGIFDELISEYFDGYLSASDFQVFLAHFEQCDRCSRLLETIRMARELCREIRPVEAPADLAERILATTSKSTKMHPEEARALRRTGLRSIGRSVRIYGWQVLRTAFTAETVAAAILMVATLGFLLADYSDDHTLRGIYRQAEARFEQLKHRRLEVIAGGERLTSNFRQIELQLSSVLTLGTLFGEKVQKSKDRTDPAQTTKSSHAASPQRAVDPSKKDQPRRETTR